MKTASVLLTALAAMISCTSQRLNFDRGIIPPEAVNFSSVNSGYDDYNSDLDITWAEKSFTLVFSTNRISAGSSFDFICYIGTLDFDLIEGDFSMRAVTKTNSLLESVNSSSNEFGPYYTADYPYYVRWKEGTGEERFFYSSDPGGNLDIFCCRYEPGDDVFIPAGDPFPLTVLNTGYNEGYLTLHPGASADRETACFMSDRNGTYDLWSATGEAGKLIDESASVTVEMLSQLSSPYDEKCPYIRDNVIVFSSNRPGGFGGFDLWFSVFSGGAWSAPENMGEMINTEYDEYRPVLVSTEGRFINELLVFSSDRPGGKGGFDLYYAGVSLQKLVAE
jgi:hypothetical protein